MEYSEVTAKLLGNIKQTSTSDVETVKQFRTIVLVQLPLIADAV